MDTMITLPAGFGFTNTQISESILAKYGLSLTDLPEGATDTLLSFNKDASIVSEQLKTMPWHTSLAKYAAMLQELRLFRGENPMDIEAGIDYLGVFNGSVYLPTQVDEVLNKYTAYFTALEASNYTVSGEQASMTIYCEFPDGTIKRDIIAVGG